MTKKEKTEMKKLQDLRYKISDMAEELEMRAALAEENSKTARTAARFNALREFAETTASWSANN